MKYENSLEYLFDKYLGGHINITKNITIYGHNAMHWGIDIRNKKFGYICFRLPLPVFDWNRPVWAHPLYFYLSPNATPWASTFCIGGGKYKKQMIKAKLRYKKFGHNFNVSENYIELCKINGVSINEL